MAGALVLRSNGLGAGSGWVLADNGYVGAYIDLAALGEATVSVAASGTQNAGVNPLMSIVIADFQARCYVSAATSRTRTHVLRVATTRT